MLPARWPREAEQRARQSAGADFGADALLAALAVAALGLVLIAAALLLPKGTPESAMAPAPATAVTPPPPSAPASPSAAPATAGVVPKATDTGQSASPAEAAATPAGSAASAAAGTTDTASADAGRLPVLDAAEAQLEADTADPAKAPDSGRSFARVDQVGAHRPRRAAADCAAGKERTRAFPVRAQSRSAQSRAKQGIVDIAKKYIELADKAGGDKAPRRRGA